MNEVKICAERDQIAFLPNNPSYLYVIENISNSMDDILSMDVSENASSSSSSSSSSACASSSSSDMSWATIQSNENDPNLLEALKVALKLKEIALCGI